MGWPHFGKNTVFSALTPLLPWYSSPMHHGSLHSESKPLNIEVVTPCCSRFLFNRKICYSMVFARIALWNCVAVSKSFKNAAHRTLRGDGNHAPVVFAYYDRPLPGNTCHSIQCCAPINNSSRLMFLYSVTRGVQFILKGRVWQNIFFFHRSCWA